jgi:Ca2+-binding RTX toxin-like protein
MPVNPYGWTWSTKTITWSFADLTIASGPFQGPIPLNLRDDVRAAFETWDGFSDLDFIEVQDSAQSQIRVGQFDFPEYLGVAWVPQRGATSITRADIALDYGVIDNDLSVSSAYRVALHEIGHVLGLDHADPSSSDIMKPQVSEPEPSADEEAWLRSVYGVEIGRSVPGSVGPDLLFGASGNDVIGGSAGNDTINGRGGGDLITGGSGIDWILGGSGKDFLYGEDDIDNVFGEWGDDAIFGGSGNDGLFGGAGNDVVMGGDGNDAMNGDAGNDTMDGGIGFDQIVAGAGNDLLFGREADDGLYGGDGNDRLDGGLGVDGLWGGAGSDTYVFDFASGGLDVVFDGEFGLGTGPGRGDLIAIQGSGMNFRTMMSLAYESGGVTVIPFTNSTGLFIVGYSIASLHQDDFAFL